MDCGKPTETQAGQGFARTQALWGNRVFSTWVDSMLSRSVDIAQVVLSCCVISVTWS